MNSEILNFPLHRFLDPSLIGQFIGPEGVNIYKIEKGNRVALDIYKNENEESMVRITGPIFNLKMALNDVCQLISVIRNDNQRYHFKIPTKDVGFLIGKHGAKINEIKMQSNVAVNFDRENSEETTMVNVIGNYNQTLTGLRLICDRLNSKAQTSLYENPRTRQFMESLLESF